MATVTLGSIKFNWKGAYNSSTAYAVDDVVSSGGNSYVCIQAHTNQAVGNATAYWNIMSSAGTNGTNGTDLTSTLTAQGDILYRDGSGLQRLAAGTAGQALITGGAGANPSWGTGGKLLAVHYVENSTRTNPSSAVNLTWLTFPSFTKVNASSILYIHGQVPMLGENADNLGCWLQINTNADPGDNQAVHKGISYIPTNSGNHGSSTIYNQKVTGIGAGSCVIYVGQNNKSNSSDEPAILNPNVSDDSRLQQTASTMIIYEVEA
jgi:hypothetical protein